MKKVCMLLSALLLPPCVYSATYDGLNVQAGLGFTSLISYDKSSSGAINKDGDIGVGANFSLGYSHSFEQRFNLAANIFRQLGSDKSGGTPDYYNAIFRIHAIRGLSIEPGYYFSPSTLAYAKLGFAKADSFYTENDGDAYSIDYGTTHGLLYGFGLKESITKNVYLGFEAYQIDFARTQDVTHYYYYGPGQSNKPSVTYGGLSLGYVFGGGDKVDPDISRVHPANAFDGFDLQAGAGFAALTTVADWVSSASQGRYNHGQTGELYRLSAGYSHHLQDNFNLATNVFYHFGSSKSGQYANSSQSYQTKDICGIEVEPGYSLAENALAYIKLGYARASTYYQYDKHSYGSSGGALYGLGFKQLVSSHVYVGLETYQIRFANSDVVRIYDNGALRPATNKPAVTYGGVLVGYKF